MLQGASAHVTPMPTRARCRRRPLAPSRRQTPQLSRANFQAFNKPSALLHPLLVAHIWANGTRSSHRHPTILLSHRPTLVHDQPGAGVERGGEHFVPSREARPGEAVRDSRPTLSLMTPYHVAREGHGVATTKRAGASLIPLAHAGANTEACGVVDRGVLRFLGPPPCRCPCRCFPL